MSDYCLDTSLKIRVPLLVNSSIDNQLIKFFKGVRFLTELHVPHFDVTFSGTFVNRNYKVALCKDNNIFRISKSMNIDQLYSYNHKEFFLPGNILLSAVDRAESHARLGLIVIRDS